MSTNKNTSKPASAGFTSADVGEIVKALSAVQSGVESSKRDQTGTTEDGRQYAYSSLGATWEAVRKLAGENGLALVQRFEGEFLQNVLFHTSGQWIDFGSYHVGKFDNHNDQGGAVSISRRYTLATVYGVAAVAEDDSDAGRVQSRAEFAAATAAITNPPSFFASDADRINWASVEIEMLSKAPDMQQLRDIFDAAEENIAGAMNSGNPEDKAAAGRVRGAFDNRRDALSQPRARRTVDSAAAKRN